MQNTQHSLTDKQLRWIDEYLVDFNGAAAAVRAGYSEKSARSIAHENATKPDIQAVLRERQVGLAKHMGVTQAGVVQGLMEAVAMARIMRNPGTMVAALREIGKICGYYEPEKVQVQVDMSGQEILERMNQRTDAELAAIVAAA